MRRNNLLMINDQIYVIDVSMKIFNVIGIFKSNKISLSLQIIFEIKFKMLGRGIR